MVAQSSSKMADVKPNCVVSNCIISLPFSTPPFVQPPFLKQLPKSNLQLLNMAQEASSNAFLHFHNSIVSTAAKCLKLLHSVVSPHHPLFSKFLSFSSHFQDFCQVHSRSYQNLGNLSHHSFAAVLPGDSVAGIVVANGIINFLNIYNSLLVARLVLTWFPNAPPAIVSPLSTLCDPYLNIFRGIIPPLGGTLDLSPILAFLVLNAFTSTASALPAELPSTTRRASSDTPPHAPVFNLTTSQKKWMRRLVGNKSKTADGES
ncbi:ylmG homolog protein 2, chloroplastic isoform X1 [Nicotiana tabacum]|uniref:YlmG homolog protein 2, chloroplastic n=1 Tax=Nicotiana tabacum TaxID=4097 RepID=A0A1S3Z5P9_TOBAC|nr:PREDICTED: ylmG homolog protein 2, chloroplastic [Nicotiana tabacum]